MVHLVLLSILVGTASAFLSMTLSPLQVKPEHVKKGIDHTPFDVNLWLDHPS
jgi:hypothetical protein